MGRKSMKVYTFYKDDTICGITTDKTIANQYQSERPQCTCKVEKMTEYEYGNHTYFYQDKVLFQNVMDDGKHVFTPITSYAENDLLEEKMYNITYRIEDLLQELDRYPLQKKYKKILNESLNYLDSEGDLRFNILRIYLRYIANYDI